MDLTIKAKLINLSGDHGAMIGNDITEDDRMRLIVGITAGSSFMKGAEHIIEHREEFGLINKEAATILKDALTEIAGGKVVPQLIARQALKRFEKSL